VPLFIPKKKYRHDDLLLLVEYTSYYGHMIPYVSYTLALGTYRHRPDKSPLAIPWFGQTTDLQGTRKVRDLRDSEDWDLAETSRYQVLGLVAGRINLDDSVAMLQYIRRADHVLSEELRDHLFWMAI
jgi:hypothetical protein